MKLIFSEHSRAFARDNNNFSLAVSIYPVGATKGSLRKAEKIMLYLSKGEDAKKKLIEKIMFEFIEKLRQKSERTKTMIAFLTSFSFSGLIFVVWLTIIYPDFTFQEKQRQAALVGNPGLFSSFFENVKEGVSGIKKEVNDINNTVNSIASSTDIYSSTNESKDVVNPAESTTKNDIQIIKITASSTDESLNM